MGSKKNSKKKNKNFKNIQSLINKNINLDKIKVKPIFKWIKNKGVTDKEMLKTFNCGVGFCLIISPKNIKLVTKYFGEKFKPYIIGKINKNSKTVKISGKISW